MAQLVAHLHGMQGVRGSSPLSSTEWPVGRAEKPGSSKEGPGFFAVRVGMPCRVWLSVEGPGGASASVAWVPRTPDTHMCRKDMDPGPGRAYRTTDVLRGFSRALHGEIVSGRSSHHGQGDMPLFYAGGGPSSGPRNATRKHHVNGFPRPSHLPRFPPDDRSRERRSTAGGPPERPVPGRRGSERPGLAP